MGVGTCLFAAVLLVSYASGIPVTSPMHICVAIYLVVGKAWHRLTSSSPRLSRQAVLDALDMEKLSALPYVRVLPMTTLSKATQFWDTRMLKQKEGTFLAEVRKPYQPWRVSMLRWNVRLSEPMFTLFDKTLCRVSRSAITSCDKREIALHWV